MSIAKEKAEIFKNLSKSNYYYSLSKYRMDPVYSVISGEFPKKGDFLVVKVTDISIINSKGLKERISTRGMIYTIEIK